MGGVGWLDSVAGREGGQVVGGRGKEGGRETGNPPALVADARRALPALLLARDDVDVVRPHDALVIVMKRGRRGGASLLVVCKRVTKATPP